jgi:hypothetical protein
MAPEFKAKLERFVTAFGAECGTKYAADGLTFDEATAQHVQFVAAVRHCGEIWAAEEADKAKLTRLKNAVGSRLATFAAGLRFPGNAA